MSMKPKLDADLSGNPVDQTVYHSKIGSLMYLTSGIPDIVQAVENGIIELYFVRIEYQLADMFTKALPEDRFKYLVRRTGSSQTEGEHIKKDKGKHALSSEEAVKESIESDSDDDETHLSESMVESSRIKKVKKFDFVTEDRKHIHLTEEQIIQQKKIKEEAKAEAAKRKSEVRKKELIDLLGPELSINLDIPLSKQDPLDKLNDLANKKRKHADKIHDYFKVNKRLKSSVQYKDHLPGTALNEPVLGFVDSDYAKDPGKGRSITGYTFLVHGCVVSWKATLQYVVSLSTTEAEYMAFTEAVKEAIWLRGLLEELGVKLNTLAINCNNQGAIHLSRNHVFHERTKHINGRYHFIREILKAKTVKVLKVGTEHYVT
nr:retrovirus-related Pol polyprotein from transposon TNT 1-94 [Tanacetum cinerariifolium]